MGKSKAREQQEKYEDLATDLRGEWNQLKDDNSSILEGTYKITVKAITIDDNIIEKIITINIFK